jgi:hypothetical protein
MRDDEYQRTAKALARETRMSDASAARIEQKLLNAVADRESGEPQHFMWLPPVGGRKWMAAAAAIALIAGSITLWNVDYVTVDTTTPELTGPKAPPTLADVVLPLTPEAVVVPSEKNAHAPRPAQKPATARVVRPNGFVELPWTAGLPAFESGEIVRVEVAVASLPAYGFDISTGTTRSVEADVLVGQDGLARAMRLVSNSVRSTQ